MIHQRGFTSQISHVTKARKVAETEPEPQCSETQPINRTPVATQEVNLDIGTPPRSSNARQKIRRTATPMKRSPTVDRYDQEDQEESQSHTKVDIDPQKSNEKSSEHLSQDKAQIEVTPLINRQDEPVNLVVESQRTVSNIQSNDQQFYSQSLALADRQTDQLLSSSRVTQDNFQIQESEEDEESYCQSESDSSDEEEALYKKEIRESMHKTQFHSVKMPLHEQTHFKQTLLDVAAEEVEKSPVREEVIVRDNAQSKRDEQISERPSKTVQSVQESKEEENSSDSDEDMLSDVDCGIQLGKAIEKADRRIKGQPTPDKDNSDRKVSKDSRKEFANEDYNTPKQSIKKVLDFTDSITGSNAFKQDEMKMERQQHILNVRDSIEMTVKSSPRLPSLLASQNIAQSAHQKAVIQAPQTTPEDVTGTQKSSTVSQAKVAEKEGDSAQFAPEFAPIQESFNNIKESPNKEESLFIEEDSDSFSPEDLQAALDYEDDQDNQSEKQEVVALEKTELENLEPQIRTQDLEIIESMSSKEQEIAIQLSVYSDFDEKAVTHDDKLSRSFASKDEEEEMKDVIISEKIFGKEKAPKSEINKNDDFSEGKKSVPSILTSNDKHSVVNRFSSNSRSSTPTGVKTGRFGGDGVRSKDSPINQFTLDSQCDRNNYLQQASEQKKDPNEGTFENVSFGVGCAASEEEHPKVSKGALRMLKASRFTIDQESQKDFTTLFSSKPHCNELELKQEKQYSGEFKDKRQVQDSPQKHQILETQSFKQEPILVVDRTSQNTQPALNNSSSNNHNGHTTTLFASSQAQFQSQQTFDVGGEFSSSQHHIYKGESGTGQYSSFKTQNSAQNSNMFNQSQINSQQPRHKHTYDNSSSNHRGGGSTTTVSISQTLNIQMTKSTQQPGMGRYRQNTGINNLNGKRVMTAAMGPNVNMGQAKAPQVSQQMASMQYKKRVPHRGRSNLTSSRFSVSSQYAKSTSTQKKTTIGSSMSRSQAQGATAPSHNTGTRHMGISQRQVIGQNHQLATNLRKKRTHQEAFPQTTEKDSHAEVGKTTLANKLKNIDLVMEKSKNRYISGDMPLNSNGSKRMKTSENKLGPMTTELEPPSADLLFKGSSSRPQSTYK